MYVPVHLQLSPLTGKMRRYIYFPRCNVTDENVEAFQNFVAFCKKYVHECTKNMDDNELHVWIHRNWTKDGPNPQAEQCVQSYEELHGTIEL